MATPTSPTLGIPPFSHLDGVIRPAREQEDLAPLDHARQQQVARMRELLLDGCVIDTRARALPW